MAADNLVTQGIFRIHRQQGDGEGQITHWFLDQGLSALYSYKR